MEKKQIEGMLERFSWYETDELIKIWQTHNPKEWTKEAFEAIRQILITRLEVLPPYEDTVTAGRILEEAGSLYDENEFGAALNLCDQAIQTAPNLSEAHYLRGMVLDELDRLEESVDSLETAIHLDPDSSDARKYLSLVTDEILQKTVKLEDRILAAMAHGSFIVLPYGIVVPTVIWIQEHKRSKFIAYQCLQALVFQVANFLFLIGGVFIVFILAMIASLLANNQPFHINPQTGIFIGAFLVYLCVLLLFFLYGIVGAVNSLLGKNFHYPVIGKLIDRFYLNARSKQGDLDSA